MTAWMDLVMEMKAKHNCSLKEAMVYAKKVYVKPSDTGAKKAAPKKKANKKK